MYDLLTKRRDQKNYTQKQFPVSHRSCFVRNMGGQVDGLANLGIELDPHLVDPPAVSSVPGTCNKRFIVSWGTVTSGS